MQPDLQAPRKMRASHHASQGNCPAAAHGAKQNNKSENGALTDQFAADTLRRRAWEESNCRIRRIEKYSLKTGYQKNKQRRAATAFAYHSSLLGFRRKPKPTLTG